MIKLLILDVDGVLTDGKKYYNVDGMPALKSFYDKDFTAIKRVKASGVPVCFLSGDNFINEEIAKNRNLDFFYARGRDKVDFLPELCEKYGVNEEDILYIGDDLFDINIMKKVGYPFCPEDAIREILDVCGQERTVSRKAGAGVIQELYDVLITRKLILPTTLQQVEELDKYERF